MIDRGSFEGYIPVWELIRDLGKEFEGAASVLEETWCNDEKARKEEWEAQQEIQAKEKLMKEARDDLLNIKKEHLNRVRLKSLFMKCIFYLRIVI